MQTPLALRGALAALALLAPVHALGVPTGPAPAPTADAALLLGTWTQTGGGATLALTFRPDGRFEAEGSVTSRRQGETWLLGLTSQGTWSAAPDATGRLSVTFVAETRLLPPEGAPILDRGVRSATYDLLGEGALADAATGEVLTRG